MSELKPADPRWTYHFAKENTPRSAGQQCPDLPYVSLTVPPDARIKRIRFATVSHDQGWSSEEPGDDPYHGSNTFFEARIVDSSGRDKVPPTCIIRNITANPNPQNHEKCWDHEQTAGVLDRFNGNGKVVNMGLWLAAIAPGDVIQIVPRAFFPAWQNHVADVSIEMWTEPCKGKPSFWTPQAGTMYRTLDTARKEIRVLTIHSGSGDEEMVASLEHLSLSDSQHSAYEALSYCWGDQSDRIDIHLSENKDPGTRATVSINRNLYNALIRLRQLQRPRKMWIDQICIDQSNNEERSQQVALMSQIFASADATRVWLGEPDQETEEDFAVIKSIAAKYGDSMRSHDEALGEAASEPSLSKLDDTHSIIKAHVYFHIINDRLFRRPWFHRVWVLQEVWNQSKGSDGKSRVTVLLGGDELPWDAILQAHWCFYTHFQTFDNAILPRLWTSLFKVSRKHVPKLTCEPGPRVEILSALIDGLDLRATDPRDKIFAILSFGEETHDIKNLPDLVRPDYDKPVTKVFSDFTLWWIREKKSLRILSAIHTIPGHTWLKIGGDHSSSDMNLAHRPSWSVWHEGRSEWRQGTLCLSNTILHNASRNRKLDLSLLDASNGRQPTLLLRGVRVGKIAQKGYFPVYSPTPLATGLRDAYYRIFDPAAIIGTWKNGKDIREIYGDVDAEGRSFGGKVGEDHFPDALAEHHYVHGQEHEGLDGHGAMTCHGKCMFETTDARIGLCPANACENDIVVILYGGEVPYLLRPADIDGHFMFIGECYVHGIMDGIALSEGFIGGVEEVFALV
ncbi:Heterokaryon incompatibility protein [Paramyrothecium foliicola]|nr:Heterokaryon incompatibility protein [Paramyrothecium foliicola]